jgi:hypothetical protein
MLLGPGRRAQVMAAAAAAARGEKMSPNKLSHGDLLGLSESKGDGKSDSGYTLRHHLTNIVRTKRNNNYLNTEQSPK